MATDSIVPILLPFLSLAPVLYHSARVVRKQLAAAMTVGCLALLVPLAHDKL